MNKRLFIFWVLSLIHFLYPTHSFAIESKNYLTGTAGLFTEIGQIGNSGMDLKNRTMTAISFDGLVGSDYIDQWIIGLDLNYRLQQQQTQLSDAGYTNLAGKSWLIGLGALYKWNSDWAFQGGLDLLGKYTFDKQTSGGQDDHLENPVALKFKAEYFLQPHLTLDFGAGYYNWATFQYGSTQRSENTNQWTIGTGLTYHFSENKKTVPLETHPTSDAPVKMETEKSMVSELKPSPIQFDANSSELSSAFNDQIKDIAKYLNDHPDIKLVINGYTDNSGRFQKNKKLSARRAYAVKKALIENNVDAKRITTVGFGEKNPTADNSTTEGRAVNRRVEINLGK